MVAGGDVNNVGQARKRARKGPRMTFEEFMELCKSSKLMVILESKKNGGCVDIRKMDLNDLSSRGLSDYMFLKGHKDCVVRFFDYNEFAGMVEVNIAD